jgi:hypothetical protein
MRGWLGSEVVPEGMEPPKRWYRSGRGVLVEYIGLESFRAMVRCPSIAEGPLGSGVGSNGMHDFTMFSAWCGAKISKIPLAAQVFHPVLGEYVDKPTPIFTEEDPAYGINDTYIDPDHTTINRMGTWHSFGQSASHYYSIDGSTHHASWGTSLGPRARDWSARAPSGNIVGLGMVHGWGSWNTR